MDSNKKPSEPLEPERWIKEFELSRIDGRSIVRINGIVIPEAEECIVAQNSNGGTYIKLELLLRSEMANVTTKSC